MWRPLLLLLTCCCIGVLAGCGSSKKSGRAEEFPIIENNRIAEVKPELIKPSTEPTYDVIQLKYAKTLHTTPDRIRNLILYRFIDKWMNTPYLWGGTTEKGIDCSAFMQRLLAEVYDLHIPRTSIEQFFTKHVEQFLATKHLSEGDLVFFQTMKGKPVSHVGLYLHNNLFINASSSKGVSIGDLKDPYWSTKYFAAGRVKVSSLARK
jgi:cell wall-associated NlpC family hydrolase